jgi:hypothetical protein
MTTSMNEARRRSDVGINQGAHDSPDSSGPGKFMTARFRSASAVVPSDALDSAHRSRVEQVVCTRMGEAIVLDLVVRDGPARDDAQLLRKSDLLAEELGLAIRITVARPLR